MVAVEGEKGDFTVTVKKAPRYVDMDKCIACGTCAEKCPRKVKDEFNQGLNARKAIYVPYPQAVPLKYLIDHDNCIYFEKGRGRACEKVCPTGAINFDDKETVETLNVGSVIITAGFKPFDPKGLEHYGYAGYANVVTSLEFERLLSAGGPTTGEIRRLSDGREPSKIAWLQCVGSRDLNRCDNPYCSSVCCMYAVKEAVMAKEHVSGDFQASIFFMDLRTYGKDFEKYVERAKAEGVRFIRSRVHSITAEPDGTLDFRYVTEAGEIVDEKFDMAVLSVGMQPADSAKALAENLGVALDPFNFIRTDDVLPVATSKPGIYVAGVSSGCKDIPESVVEASAAACSAATDLAPARGSRTRQKTFPAEKDVSGQEPKIGVFVCNCGTNIGGIADVPAIAEYARSLPGVTYVEENLFTCSQDTQDKITEVIRSQDLNRVVVAACTPRTHEPLFQETIRNAGLNPYLFEMANIRNQCTWVHSGDAAAATEKSKDLVKMAVMRANQLEPLDAIPIDVNKSALVVGGGIAGMTAAKNLADQGFSATLVEQSDTLGGAARDIPRTAGGTAVGPYLEDLAAAVRRHPLVDVMTGTTITGGSGFLGNFKTEVTTGETSKTIDHGVAVIATGGQAADTDEYRYHQSDRVTRWHEFWQHPAMADLNTMVFIQCVGSRTPERPYCSKVCCTASINSALAVKEQHPDANVFILYRDIRTYGDRELLYQKAREKGILFIRYSAERKPEVRETADGLAVHVFDPMVQKNLVIEADLVNLATAIEPADNAALANLFKVSLNAERFLMEAHPKLRPVDCATDGVFVCGLAHYPKFIEESIAQAQAAAARAAGVLSRDRMEIEPIVSQVDDALCIGCGLCEKVCAFGAIRLQKVDGTGYRAENISALCKGCGVCAAACPQKAIDMHHFKDAQINAAVAAGV